MTRTPEGSWTGGFYVTPAGATALRQYKHLLTPMNKWLLQFVPLWLAPNVMTLIGFAFVVSAHLASLYYAPNFSEIMPTWLRWYIPFAIFAYQTIDNLDGQQARKTSSSSPLGLLFDHGLDAANLTVLTLLQCAVFQTGSGWILFLMWSMAVTAFTCATWEEYYTGKLVLQYVNGPTDGAAIYPGLWGQPCSHLFPSLMGTFFERQPLCLLPIGFGVACLIATILSNVFNVATKNINRDGGAPLLTLLPFASLCGLGLAWSWFSPSHVYNRHPRLFLFMLGFLLCNLLCKLMLAHLCRYRFKYLRSVLTPLALIVCLVLSTRAAASMLLIINSICLMRACSAAEDTLLYLIAAIHFAFWLHLVVNVILEITQVLNISWWRIPFPRSDSTVKAT